MVHYSAQVRVSVFTVLLALAGCSDSSDDNQGAGGSAASGGAGGATGGTGASSGSGGVGASSGSGGSTAGTGAGGAGGVGAAGAGGISGGGTGGAATGGTSGAATGGTSGAATGGTGGAGQCSLAASPACNTMTMPAAATFVTGVVGTLPSVSGGGVIPPGTFVLIKQIIGSGTPATRKLAVYGGSDGCFTALEIAPDLTEARYSGTSSYTATEATTTFTCPIELSVSPTFQVLTPVGGKVRYATINGDDYREWLEQ